MEKRFYIGLCILTVLLILGVAVSVGMTACHRPGVTLLEQARDCALDGDMEQAVTLAEKARDNWARCWRITAATADHNPMDEVDRLFGELQVYADAPDEAPHFAACCGELAVMLRAMYDAHTLTLWNLL